jgi:2-polyprenyl-6-methoxyphenol hydroxylase-like FAD-dependent oxidoreductase
MPNLKILIVGAGLGGLALASFLDDCEVEYSIIEKCPQWCDEGFALGLWNNGRHILRKLGLAHWVDETEIAFQSVVICDGKGNKLRSYNLSRFYSEFGMAYSHVRRADLHRWLLGRVARKVHMGTSLASMEEKEDGVTVWLSDGTHDRFDLVVGADGVHSTVRDCCFQRHLESYTDWRAWYVWVDRSFCRPRTVSQYVAPNECIAVFDEGDKALVVLIAKTDHSIWDDAQERINRLKSLFCEEPALIPQLLNKAIAEKVCSTDLIEISLKHWHTAGVVLIGDAAHGFEPFGGLGGSMALEDAYVLAAQLGKLSNADRRELSLALARYETIRKRRVHEARKITRRMQCWATIESPFLRQIVNHLAPIVPESWITRGYFAFMRHEM